MVIEDDYNNILEHIKKHHQINTFRLASELGIDRHKILNIIKKLEEKGAVEFKTGKVRFLKFPKEEKKARIEVKKAPSVPKIRAKSNELEAGIKRQHYTKSKKFREQDELIEKLENRIEALKQKANAPPKVITKIIRKKIEVPKIITKTIVKRIIKRVPVEVIKKVPVRVKESEAKSKFKLPKINLPNIKNIQQLERPDFLEQKIRAGKINFSALNKNIQQLHVPEMLRNN